MFLKVWFNQDVILTDNFEEVLGKLLEWNDAEIAKSFSMVWNLRVKDMGSETSF